MPVETTDLVLNSKILENLAQVKLEIEDLTSIKINSSLLEILRWPGVCQHKDIDETQIIKILNDPFMDAVEQLKASRHSEGKELTKVIERKLASYTSNFLQIGENQSEINKELVKKFKDRILELTQSPDNARLEQECAILIQKMDITEEIDRIRYHLTSLETILKKGGPRKVFTRNCRKHTWCQTIRRNRDYYRNENLLDKSEQIQNRMNIKKVD